MEAWRRTNKWWIVDWRRAKRVEVLKIWSWVLGKCGLGETYGELLRRGVFTSICWVLIWEKIHEISVGGIHFI